MLLNLAPWLAILTAALIVVLALGRWPQCRPAPDETVFALHQPPVPTQAEVDATWLRAWTFVDVDAPTRPFSWAEQERLDEIERREFSGGAA